MGKKLDRSEWHNNVASICESKKGILYLKFNPNMKGELVIHPGDMMRMKPHQDVLDELLEKGIIDQDEYDEKSESQEFIKYQLTLPPLED